MSLCYATRPAPISGVATATRCRVKLPGGLWKHWKGPQALLRDINRYLQGEAPVIKAPPPDDETLASATRKLWRVSTP